MSVAARCFFIGVSWNDSAVSAYFRALGSDLAERGDRVVFIVDGRRTEVEAHEANPAVYTWPSKRPVHWRDARFLARLVRTYAPDCLIGNFGSVNVMMIVGAIRRVPARVAWHHTLSGQIDLDTALAGWQVKTLRWRKQAVYALATHVATNSQATARDVRETFGVPAAKCKILPILVNDPCADGRPLPVRQPRRVVCVGGLAPAKGQDVLLKAVPQLLDRFADICLEFIGDGPQRQAYEQLATSLGIADHCRWHGFLPNPEVLASMAAAAVVVVPSRAEAFGIVNVEALSVGTPVVASDVDGVREIIRDGLDGYLVPADDPDALAAALTKVLDGGPDYELMKRNARERFLQVYEMNSCVGAHADWYVSLTS